MIDNKTRNEFRQALANAVQPDQIYNNQYFSRTGFVDSTVPTERQVKRDFTGIFFSGLYMRADMAAEFMQKLWVERYIGQQEYEMTEESHPWVILLRTPNKQYSSYYIWQWTVLNLDLQGHADFVCEYDNRNVLVQIHPLFKEFGEASPLPSPSGSILGWRFTRSDGMVQNYDARAILRIGRRNPLNPYETLSIIEASKAELEEDAIMKHYRQKSASEGGWNNNLLTTDKDLTPQQHNELSDAYKRFRGANNINNVGILSSGMKPVQLMNAKDLEYIQGRIQTLDIIREILGIKGLGEPATTRASAEAVRFDVIQSTIAPLVRLVASELTTSLTGIFNAEPGVLEVRPPDMIPLDPEFELRKRRILREIGTRTLNDDLREEGDDIVPYGDKRYIPMGWKEMEEAEIVAEPTRSAKRNEEVRSKIWRRVDNLKKKEASKSIGSVQAYFDEIERQVLRTLRESDVRTIDNVYGVPFDITKAMSLWMETITPEAGRILGKAFAEVMAMTGTQGLEFSLFSPQARAALETILAKQQSVPLTLQDKIADLIQEGISTGDSNSKIMASVREYFDESVPGKIDNIVNTLTTATWETGQQVAYNMAGIERKEWLSSRDERVRPTHFEADGQIVDINAFFKVGTAELRNPADPESDQLEETIGCRCSTLPITEERNLISYAKRYCR